MAVTAAARAPEEPTDVSAKLSPAPTWWDGKQQQQSKRECMEPLLDLELDMIDLVVGFAGDSHGHHQSVAVRGASGTSHRLIRANEAESSVCVRAFRVCACVCVCE